MTKPFIEKGDILILCDYYANEFVNVKTYYGFSLQDFDIKNVIRKDLELKKHNFIQIATLIGPTFFYLQKANRKYETALYLIKSSEIVVHHGIRVCMAF